jgi:hypothetical protein
MKITNHKGSHYVLRQRKGQWFAAAFSGDLDDRQIRSRVVCGDAAFFPFNKKKWEFDWNHPSAGRIEHFRR